MSEQEIEQHVLDLITGISGVSYDTLMMAFNETDEYKVWPKKKKSGNGYRLIAEPPENLKKFQGGLLKTLMRLQKRREYYIRNTDFLPYDVRLDDLCKNISSAQHGGLRRKSTSTLIQQHIWSNANFIVKVDLKKAFPHATHEMVKKLFYDLFIEEVSFLYTAMTSRKKFLSQLPLKTEYEDMRLYRYERLQLQKQIKQQYPRYTLFPTTRVPNFRKLLRSLHASSVEYPTPEVSEILERTSLYLTELVTRKFSIPQGAPTSSMILNILLARAGVFDFLEGQVFHDPYVTIYTDDIIISTPTRPTVDEINRMVEKLASIGFPYHPKKLYVYDLRGTSAYVLGMKLVRRVTPENEILLKRGSPGFKSPHGFARANRIGREWYATHATLPKSVQKKYRACFHQLCTTVGWNPERFDTAIGYHGHIVSTYGWPTAFMPASLKTIVQQFRDMFYLKGSSVLGKDSSQTRTYSEQTTKRHQFVKTHQKQFPFSSDPVLGSDTDLPF